MGEFTDGELSKDPSTLKHHPALVLNADYRPLSYYPLSLWCWQDAVKAAYMERVDIVAQYDKFVHSPTIKIKIPSVVVLKDYVKPQKAWHSQGLTYSYVMSSDASTVEIGEN